MMFSDLISETVTALSANKARSSLTILGIVIGIGSVIAMVSIGQGAQGSIQSRIEGLGSNLLTVTPGFSQAGRGVVSQGRGSAQTLTWDDVAALKALNGVAAVSPEFSQRIQVTSTVGTNTNTNVLGITPGYAVARTAVVANGSFITERSVQGLGRVAVLGPTAATDLFADIDPIGKTIRIRGISFTITGVLEPKGGSGFSNSDDTILVPLTTMQKILAGSERISQIAISVVSKDQMPAVKQDATSLLLERHKVTIDAPDFSILSQEDILGALTQVTDTLTIFLASVAGISLVVGGIGIMNMMLTTVTERTREIGLRKAIGARKADITAQFLMEAVVLTFLGGVFGIAIGWLVSIAVTYFAGIATSVSLYAVVLACSVSAGIGIVFGYYPARRAASLHPIEALRYE